MTRQSRLLPRDQFPPGLGKGEYVTLSFEEFRHGYDVFSAALEGTLPLDPTFPKVYQDGRTGEATPMEDTAFTRAWYSAGKLFTDEAKRISFYARVKRVMDIALSPKYAKYVNRAAGSFHVALLGAVAAVRFSSRTNPKALRAAFDAEFHRYLATTVDTDDTEPRQ